MTVKHIKPRLSFLRQSFVILLIFSTIITISVNFLLLQIGLAYIYILCKLLQTLRQFTIQKLIEYLKPLCNVGNLQLRYIVHDPKILPRILKLNSRLLKEWWKL